MVRHALTRTQQFLRGHDNDISVIRVSNTGKYIASGQKTHMGFQADIIVWDFDNMSMLHRFKLHKVLIQDLSFSADEQFLASLGGQDDNQLVIWDISSGKALVGHPVGMNVANRIQFFNLTNNKLLTIHVYGLRLWNVDLEAKKILYTDIQMGTLKRIYNCVCIDPLDQRALLGTHTGDIVEISLDHLLFKRIGPAKRLFSKGINTIRLL